MTATEPRPSVAAPDTSAPSHPFEAWHSSAGPTLG
ncbi:MAG: hypothetical protein JWR88_2332, partial [Pseudonocardia sp.]|nr:hypothetical protein [Pseudonocardia sp.]